MQIDLLRSPPLFPAKWKGTLRYADNNALSTTAGAVNTFVFSANGMFDPNITGTGHQPAGFDQMMISYEHYTVVRSRIVVNFINQSGNTFPTCAVSYHAGSTPITVITQIVEDGMISMERLDGANGSHSTSVQRLSGDVAKFGGIRDLLDNPDYKGTIAANPVEQQYYHVQTWSTDATTSTITFEAVIEYEAWFTEPRSLSQSLKKALHRGLAAEERKT